MTNFRVLLLRASAHQFERGAPQPRRSTMDVIVRTFEAVGIEFIAGDVPGMKLHKRATAPAGRKKKKTKPK